MAKKNKYKRTNNDLQNIENLPPDIDLDTIQRIEIW
jgi:hypothetical protein